MLSLGKLIDELIVRYRSWREQILKLLSTSVLMISELLELKLMKSMKLLKYLILAYE